MAKNVFFNLYKNKLFNQFHAVKLSLVAVKSTDWNMKLSCFPKVGTTQAVSSPWVRCLATWGAVFLNYSSVLQACMHWVYENVFGIFQTVHFFSNDFTFWLITHSHFSNNIPFYKQRHDKQSVKICWRTLMIPMKKDQAWFRDASYRVSD